MSETIRRFLRDIPRAVVFTLVFFGIPLGLVVLGCQQWWDEEVDQKQRLLVQKLDSYLASWRIESPFLTHLEYALRGEGSKALSGQDPQRSLREFFRSLKQRFPDTLHFVRVTPNGEIDSTLSDIQPPADLFRRFFRDYQALAAQKTEFMTANVNQYRSFLGPMIGRDKEVKLYNKFLHVSQREKHAYVYLSPITSAGMFIAFIDRHPRLEEVCLKDIVLTHQKKRPSWIFDLFQLRDGTATRVFAPAQNETNGEALLGLLESGAQPYLFQDGYLWASMAHIGTHRLLLGIPDSSQKVRAERQHLLRVAMQSVFAALLVSVWLLFSRIPPVTLSIRTKLTLLFVYLVGTPLLLMAISAHGFVRDRRTVLENEMFRKQEEFLNAFDRRYPEANGAFERELHSILAPPLRGPNTLTDLRERFDTLNALYKPVMGEVFDNQGKTRYQLETSWSDISRRIITGIQGAAANLLRDINQEPLQEKVSAKEQLINMTAEFLGFNIEMIMAGFSQNLGCLQEFGVSRGTIQVMMTPLYDQGGQAQFLSLLAWHNETLETRYVRSQLASFSLLLPHSQLFAYNSERENCVPAHFADYDLAREYLLHVNKRETPLKHLVETSSGTRFLCAMEGKNLKNYLLFVFSDSISIDAELRRFLHGYILLSAFILFLSLCSGKALARRFFVPVGHFETGLQAIAHRRFEHRIPVASRDEFGMLATTFNVMLESLEDLEVAKVVQETFFPQEPLECGDWEVFGSSIAASRVGGDYFDYFRAGEDRVCIVIGDVSGHGVGAALVVAMAKALLCHPQSDANPQKVLQTIQEVLLKTLKRKKIMTCFCAIFQPSSGILLASNAGHSFPYIVHHSHLEQIELPGSPLGTRLCRVESPVQRLLDESMFLFLYTDGFVEATDADGTMIGNRRVESMLAQMRGENARETIARLHHWHSQQTGERHPPEDDVTFVVLQHKNSAGSKTN